MNIDQFEGLKKDLNICLESTSENFKMDIRFKDKSISELDNMKDVGTYCLFVWKIFDEMFF